MAQYKGAASEGNRAMHMQKRRDKAKEQMEELKAKIVNENAIKSNIHNKFSTHYDAVEAELKSSTVGLVTLNEMRARQETLIQERQKQIAMSNEAVLKSKKEQVKKKERSRKIAALSFAVDDEDDDQEEEEEIVLPKKPKKNPDVDTSFLPDRDREIQEKELKEQIRKEWVEKQERMKNEEIEITYSYWDGSGHRRKVKMKKGNSIQQFLIKCIEQLRTDFSELRTAGVEHLMYVKEDLIIPQYYTFYDFIMTKARGKSGSLFQFDVHDDVRLVGDATVEKDESHAGKVVLRHWFEKNKHIFPASRWEPYDPEKKFDKYTVK
uniref:protein FAM50A n=1 Tax=Ciona intestinalis TaxID=7719 RepID=UPI0002B8DD86|nr:protein FAM50A [Ciona intestinalis]|eukprot:XP_002131770.2 protein FAM50A [Ciona intestinalis]